MMAKTSTRRQRIAVLLLLAAAMPGLLAAEERPDEALVGSFPMRTTLPDTFSIDLPFENGRSLSLMVDTGSQVSVLSRASAKAIEVKFRSGNTGPYTATTASGHRFDFYVDMSRIEADRKEGLEYGVVGGPFLAQFVVEIDFAEEQLRLLDPQRFRVEEQVRGETEAVVPIEVTRNRPFVSAEVDGRKIPLLVSTGAPAAVMLSSGSARRAKLEARKLPRLVEMFSLQGRIESRLYDAQSVSFAGFDLGPTPVMVVDNGYYRNGTDPLVGFDALRQFSLRIDYARARMWLRRNRTDQRHLGMGYAKARKVGVVLMSERGEYRVHAVLPDTPAAALGLEPDDVLVLSHSVEEQNLDSILDEIASGSPMMVRRQARSSREADNEVKLPDAATYDTVRKAAAAEHAVAAAEDQKREREEFEAKRNQRVYARTRSGWQVVDAWRIPRGPREGEEWFTHEEFLEMRAREAEKD